MSKRPIMICLAVCCLTAALLSAYFTMFANVNDIDSFFNRVSAVGNKPLDVSPSPEKNGESEKNDPQETVGPAETEPPEPDYTEISVLAAGDLLIHDNFFNTQYDEESKKYDFTNIFSDVKELISQADYAAASLEVPFGGGEYSGYPKFNCPDELATAAASAGFDMLNTAGEHAFDAGISGFFRTLDVLEEEKVTASGTAKDGSTEKYTVKDIGGIKIGFMTFAKGERNSNGRLYFNGNSISAEQEKMINFYEADKLDEFYAIASDYISKMKENGAEVIFTYIRWGDNYTVAVSETQKEIASKLCDLGVDVIIGNGPHMIQPFEVLKSSDGERSTLCMYSLGNFVSNQRRELISYKSGHTEDGIMYTINIRKYSDGSVKIMNVDYVPTWLSLSDGEEGKQVYKIVPLYDGGELTDKDQIDSYNRTAEIVKDAIDQYNSAFTIDVNG